MTELAPHWYEPRDTLDIPEHRFKTWFAVAATIGVAALSFVGLRSLVPDEDSCREALAFVDDPAHISRGEDSQLLSSITAIGAFYEAQDLLQAVQDHQDPEVLVARGCTYELQSVHDVHQNIAVSDPILVAVTNEQMQGGRRAMYVLVNMPGIPEREIHPRLLAVADYQLEHIEKSKDHAVVQGTLSANTHNFTLTEHTDTGLKRTVIGTIKNRV
jgi:hypothetical protein